MLFNQELPHNKQAELNVIGTVMRYNEYYEKASDIISTATFYEMALSDIWRCMAGVITEGGITTISSIETYAKAHRVELKNDVLVEAMTCCSEFSFEQDVALIRHMELQRRLWQTFTMAASRIIEPMADIEESCETTAKAVTAITGENKSDGIASLSQALDEVAGIINDNINGVAHYLATGFRIFDEHYLLRSQTLTVIAAFTSVGKSALALNIAEAVANNGNPVAYYSLEMAKSELAARIVSRHARVTAVHLLNAKLSNNELSTFQTTRNEQNKLPIYFDDASTTTFKRTMRSIRKVVRTRGVKLVVIDYLQIYAQNGESVESSLAAMARDAKNIAKELNIAVILLSQLNRSAPHPSIKMLRGSGQIEESADNIVLIDRPEAYPDNNLSYEGEFANESTHETAKLILAKGRGVGTGCALVGFKDVYTTFYELEDKNKFETKFTEVDWDTPF